MHHVRKLADLNKKGKREMPLWMKVMISRKRKSIPLCKRCHDDIHFNRPKVERDKGTGEPDDATSIKSGSEGG